MSREDDINELANPILDRLNHEYGERATFDLFAAIYIRACDGKEAEDIAKEFGMQITPEEAQILYECARGSVVPVHVPDDMKK